LRSTYKTGDLAGSEKSNGLFSARSPGGHNCVYVPLPQSAA